MEEMDNPSWKPEKPVVPARNDSYSFQIRREDGPQLWFSDGVLSVRLDNPPKYPIPELLNRRQLRIIQALLHEGQAVIQDLFTQERGGNNEQEYS